MLVLIRRLGAGWRVFISSMLRIVFPIPALRAFSLRGAWAGALVLAAIGSSTVAEIETFDVAPSRTVVQFKLRHMLGTVVGHFHETRGVLHLDPDAPERSSVVVTIPSRTVDTGIPLRDEHLRSELFEVLKYPEITFRSRRVRRTGRDQADITGDLTLHGVTKPLLLHVTLLGRTKNARGAEVSRWRATGGTFERSSFGLVWSKTVEAVSMIGDNISLEIEAETARSD